MDRGEAERECGKHGDLTYFSKVKRKIDDTIQDKDEKRARKRSSSRIISLLNFNDCDVMIEKIVNMIIFF